jgi:hypothetical protein
LVDELGMERSSQLEEMVAAVRVDSEPPWDSRALSGTVETTEARTCVFGIYPDCVRNAVQVAQAYPVWKPEQEDSWEACR